MKCNILCENQYFINYSDKKTVTNKSNIMSTHTNCSSICHSFFGTWWAYSSVGTTKVPMNLKQFLSIRKSLQALQGRLAMNSTRGTLNSLYITWMPTESYREVYNTKKKYGFNVCSGVPLSLIVCIAPAPIVCIPCGNPYERYKVNVVGVRVNLTFCLIAYRSHRQ